MTIEGDTSDAGASNDRRAAPPRRLTTILAADLCSYSNAAEANPEGAARAVAALTARIDRQAQGAGGRLFHRAGDGFLCELPTATAGVRVARALIDSLGQDPIDLVGQNATLRVGVHTGEVTEEASGDLLGHAVNVAARLQGEARPGGVVVSATTFALAEDQAPLRRIGDLKLKNMRDPVTAYELVTEAGFVDRLKTLTSTRWVRRNARAFVVLGLIMVVGATMISASIVARNRAVRATQAAEIRAAALEDDAARLAAQLLDKEARLLDQEAVEQAALALLSSADPLKAEARALALEGRALATATALRRAYAAQEASGASAVDLAQTALQAGAFALGQDQSLAQWAYERAYAALPREPFVLLQLASIASDRNEDEDARSYLSALLAIDPAPNYAIEAELGLAFIAQDQDRFEEAERRLARALAIARAADLSREEAEVLSAFGALDLFRLGALDDQAPSDTRDALVAGAEANLRRALRVYRALDDAKGATHALIDLGRLAHISEDMEGAASRYEEAFVLTEQMGDLPAIASLAFNLSSVHHAMGHPKRRDAYWDVALAATESGAVESMLGILHVSKAGFHLGDGDRVSACDQIEVAKSYYAPGDMSIARLSEAMIPDLSCDDAITTAERALP